MTLNSQAVQQPAYMICHSLQTVFCITQSAMVVMYLYAPFNVLPHGEGTVLQHRELQFQSEFRIIFTQCMSGMGHFSPIFHALV